LLDSLYDDIPAKYAEKIIHQWPFLSFSQPLLTKAVGLNLKEMLNIPSTELNLPVQMSRLYPKAVVFIEKEPLNDRIRALYDAAREPKELLRLKDTAAGELIGPDRETYNKEVEQEINKYLPISSNEKTLAIPK